MSPRSSGISGSGAADRSTQRPRSRDTVATPARRALHRGLTDSPGDPHRPVARPAFSNEAPDDDDRVDESDEASITPIFVRYLYRPAITAVGWISGLLHPLQSGDVNVYLLYVFIAVTSLMRRPRCDRAPVVCIDLFRTHRYSNSGSPVRRELVLLIQSRKRSRLNACSNSWMFRTCCEKQGCV